MAVKLELHLAADSDLRILQLSDCHFLERPGQTLMGVDTERSFAEVLEAVQACEPWPPDLILLTGDLVQTPSLAAYQRLHAHLARLGVPWVCLPGNHDDPGQMAAALCQNQAHCSKQIIAGAWRILCLDSRLPGSHTGHLDTGELAFLARNVASDSRHTLVALHHPPLPVGSAWMDAMQLDNSEDFFAILDDHRHIKGVVFGHIHQVFSATWRHIRLWSAPSTCFQFKPFSEDFAVDERPPGWRWITLAADGGVNTRVEWLDRIPPGLDFATPGY